MRLANKRVFEALVKSGACDSLVWRTSATAGITGRRCKLRSLCRDRFGRSCSRPSMAPASTARGTSATRIWGSSTCSAAASRTAPARRRRRCRTCRPWSEIDQLNFEKESLGLFWSGHPIDRYAEDLRDYGAKTILELNPVKRRATTSRRSPADGDERAARPGRREHRWQLPSTATVTAAQRERQRQSGELARPRSWRRRLDRRHRLGPAPAEDAQGRPHVRLHARRCGRQPRNRGVPGDVQAVRPRRRDRPAGAGEGEVREATTRSARIVASEIVPIEMVRERLAKVGGDPRVDAARTSRATFERLLGRVRAAQGRPPRGVRHRGAGSRHQRVTADVSGSACGRRSAWCPKWRRSAAPGSVSLRSMSVTPTAGLSRVGIGR